MNIPFINFSPAHESIKAEMLQAFEDVYDSNWFVLGKNLEEFELEYAKANRVKYSVGVSNGLDALYLSLKANGVAQGDEVIVPSNTYIATALAVSHLNAKPVFVEPRLSTYNINPNEIANSITSKTKAIIPVHLYGQSCEMDQIMMIADQNGLIVVEDNAQGHLAKFKGQMTGSWGHANATSFYPGKNLGALGDAGAITTNDSKIADRLRLLLNYGSKIKYENEIIGYNKRLDELQAAFLRVKLRKLEFWTEQRQSISKVFDEMLQGLGDLILPEINEYSTHVYHLYVVRTSSRNQLQEYLKNRGVQTLIHYPIPPHRQNAYAHLGHKKGYFPIAEELAETSLSLPIWPGMTQEMLDYIVACIKSFFTQG